MHDSFWTHAASVDEMNVILRNAFVQLHSRPLLQELLEHFQAVHPGLTFPPVPSPTEPQLDLNDVRASPYFFS